MKKFEAPEMDIQKFEVQDVITTSGGEENIQPSIPDMGGLA